MVNVYAFEGLIPMINTGAYVHPTAILIGDVVIEAGCFTGPGAANRADVKPLHVAKTG